MGVRSDDTADPLSTPRPQRHHVRPGRLQQPLDLARPDAAVTLAAIDAELFWFSEQLQPTRTDIGANLVLGTTQSSGKLGRRLAGENSVDERHDG
jgi:hypothetical protein